MVQIRIRNADQIEVHTCATDIGGVMLTLVSGLSAVTSASFLTATVTGKFPSVALRVGAVGNPGPAGNGFTPACTICCRKIQKNKNNNKSIMKNRTHTQNKKNAIQWNCSWLYSNRTDIFLDGFHDE